MGHLKIAIFMGFILTKYAFFLVFTKILHILLRVPEIAGILGAVHQSRYIWGYGANAGAEPIYAKKFRETPHGD